MNLPQDATPIFNTFLAQGKITGLALETTASSIVVETIPSIPYIGLLRQNGSNKQQAKLGILGVFYPFFQHGISSTKSFAFALQIAPPAVADAKAVHGQYCLHLVAPLDLDEPQSTPG